MQGPSWRVFRGSRHGVGTPGNPLFDRYIGILLGGRTVMEGSKDPLFLASIPSVQTYVEAPFLYSLSLIHI